MSWILRELPVLQPGRQYSPEIEARRYSAPGNPVSVLHDSFAGRCRSEQGHRVWKSHASVTTELGIPIEPTASFDERPWDQIQDGERSDEVHRHHHRVNEHGDHQLSVLGLRSMRQIVSSRSP